MDATCNTLKYARAIEYPKMVNPRGMERVFSPFVSFVFRFAFALHQFTRKTCKRKRKRKQMENFPFLASVLALAFAFAFALWWFTHVFAWACTCVCVCVCVARVNQP